MQAFGDLAGLRVDQVILRVLLAGDELHDVRMVDPEDAHVGATAGAALLNVLCGVVVDLHEGDGATGDATGLMNDGLIPSWSLGGETAERAVYTWQYGARCGAH